MIATARSVRATSSPPSSRRSRVPSSTIITAFETTVPSTMPPTPSGL